MSDISKYIKLFNQNQSSMNQSIFNGVHNIWNKNNTSVDISKDPELMCEFLLYSYGNLLQQTAIWAMHSYLSVEVSKESLDIVQDKKIPELLEVLNIKSFEEWEILNMKNKEELITIASNEMYAKEKFADIFNYILKWTISDSVDKDEFSSCMINTTSWANNLKGGSIHYDKTKPAIWQENIINIAVLMLYQYFIYDEIIQIKKDNVLNTIKTLLKYSKVFS